VKQNANSLELFVNKEVSKASVTITGEGDNIMSDTQSPQEQDKNKGGRPKVHKFDYEQIERLGELMCSQREIAHVLGCHAQTIKRDPKALEAIAVGTSHGKIKLRRAMMRNACENMNAAVQIFLAKNLLAMSDNGLIDGDGTQPLPWPEKQPQAEDNNATDETTTDNS
jgi:hypothetical protein